ncbi:MAG: SDR family NAD(P)-dependent oxidoreductase [Burkholderiales bacterium]
MSQPSAPALTALQRTFLALEEAQARIAAMELAAREPIAVIGVGCRLPGGANDPASFWQLMSNGVDAIGPVPAERWDADALYDADPATPGRIATRAGGFLGAIDRFDAGFFGIAPREAQGMDPQQRLLLEVSWEALEHAGQAPDRLERSATGVFIGMCSSDYAYMQLKSEDTSLLDAHFTSGVAHSIVSGRLSYLMGLQGPSLTIDTACSSSLVAVHLACQSLRSGESRMALAGGVNLILSPDLYIALSHSRMLAPDGRCKTFDAAADGFARGEGCGVVVLKRLSDAQADGDRILAVIRGSAVNQDGPSSGLTAPNGPAQEAVVREALARSGLAPKDIGFVEAHGTGTQLGDPLEVHALGAVFGADRDPKQPLYIGSVKTNIGHLEGAAGVTGLIKLVLALQQKTIPAHLHFHNPSPHIAWGELPLKVPVHAMAWPAIEGRRIGGVSSFGFSGTNAHVVVEEAPPPAEVQTTTRRAPWLLALSARDEVALAELAARHRVALEGCGESELGDYCFSANSGRAVFAQRATLAAHSIDELRFSLDALARGQAAEGLRSARVAHGDPPRIAFLFTGQGAQYTGMARGLYAAAPVFRDTLDRCAALLAGKLERPLFDVLFASEPEASALDDTAYTQPALFALEYSLAALWRSWGVTPNVVMGHSVGEYVAACIAGVLSLEDAIGLIAERGRLMQSLPAGGAMAAVFAPEAQVAAALAVFGQRVSVAAVNGPDQTVISGAADSVETLCREFTAAGVRCKPLVVSHAFHSPLVEPILDAFERAASTVHFAAPQLRLVSNLTGQVAVASEVTQPVYWRRHVREAVRFGAGLQALAALRPDCIVEVGPHPTLLSFAAAAFGDTGPTLVSSLRRGRDDWAEMQDTLATLWLAGVAIDWRGVAQGGLHRIVDVPTYPFQRERHWFQARPPLAHTAPRGRATGHPLLGTRLRSAGAEPIFESHVGADSPPFMRQHRVQGQVVVPGTAYLDTLHAAACALLGSEQVCVEDVTIREAMLLEDDGATRCLQLVAGTAHDGAVALTLSSVADAATTRADDADAWVGHVTAVVRSASARSPGGASLAQARERCIEVLPADEFYAGFERRGLDFGADFRSVRQLWCGAGQALGEVELSPGLAHEALAYRVHPVLLDGCLQVLAAALRGDSEERLYLPVGIGRYAVSGRATARCWSHVVVQPGSGESRRADIQVFDADGAPLAELRDVQLQPVSRDALARLGERWLDDALYETVWRAAPAGAPTTPPVAVLVAAGSAALEDLRQTSGLAEYDLFLPQLEALCVDYVVQAMNRLDWAPVIGEGVTAHALAERLGVAARHHRLFGRLLTILEEAGHLRRSEPGWTVLRQLGAVQPSQRWERLNAEFPGGGAELELTGRVAERFAEALRGEVEPMQLLFPDGSLDTTERLYRDTPTARFYNGLVAEVVAAAAAAHAAGRPLRVLEIGAGTGGTTAHVLPRLPAQGVEYTFTDIGPLFVARARERFGAHPFMRYQVLDLEREPQQQGLAPGSFDLVIASNVVHATADLRRTLARVRQLLVPGGLLAMLEVTAPQRWFDLTVGLTEGWWAFTDTDLRPDYATLPRERWLSLLGNCGFDTAAALPEGSGHQGALALQSLLLARAAVEPVTTAARRDWLLFADRSGLCDALCAELRARGDRCTRVLPGALFAAAPDEFVIDPTAPGDYRRLLHDLRNAGRELHGVLHAWALDATPWETSSAAALASAQSLGVVSAMWLAQTLVGIGPVPRLWLLTRGGQQADALDRALDPAQAPLWGLGKALALEHPELRCVNLDLDPARPSGEAAALWSELQAADTDTQVAWRSGERRVARLSRLSRVPSGAAPATRDAPYRLVPATPGELDRFELAPAVRRAPGAGQVEIAVEATGLNFKDVLNVLGLYPGEAGPLGGECAGRVVAVGAGVTHVRAGDEVLAVAGGSFASHVIAAAELVQLRPAGMNAEEGAAFPIAFLTAEFCLGHLARLQAGERVLIHAAAGGVGMAAVRLAQRAGAEVFATAGSEGKRELLRSIGVSHVFDSRDAGFAAEILRITAGRGVDVVLNSLSGELIDSSFNAIARAGRFVEIGKRGIKTSAQVDALDRDLRYHVVDWGETAQRDPALIGAMFARLVDAVRTGALRSLPRHVFALEDAARAFRFMAQARHTGKIVVRHGPQAAAAIRRDGSYLVTGGLSGLGPVLARWLADRGAGRIVLIGRRGVTPEVAPLIDVLRAQGCAVIAEALDVTDAAAMQALLTRLRADGPPLRGVIHSAGVLADAGLLQQDAARFEHVFGPKIYGARLLHTLTGTDPLDFFVLFSSVAAVLGSAGQSNHSAANAFLDLLARERRSRGLPGLSINWGAWAEVGAAVDRGVAERIAAQGLGSFTTAQGLQALQRLLGQDRAQVAVLPVDWRRYVEHTGQGTTPAFLSELTGAVQAAVSTATPTRGTDLRDQVASAAPGRRRPIVAAFVRERALRALGLDPSRAIDPRTPLGELGLDSLLAVELRNTLGKALGHTLPATLLFDYPTITALTDYLVDEVLTPSPGVLEPAAPAAASVTLVDSIEDLSDEEVERQLAARAKTKA